MGTVFEHMTLEGREAELVNLQVEKFLVMTRPRCVHGR